MNFTYADSPYPIREDIREAHGEYWHRLAKPGSWWTGSERVAIAREARTARSCAYCVERKSALSPYAGNPEHTSDSSLNELAVDAIHRIMTDQTRITQRYIETNRDAGLSEEAYVELAGIVVAMISIDEFNRSLGLPFEPLPDPIAGEPDHYRPPNLTRDTGFVPMLTRDGATGAESDLWSGDRTANVLRALTLVPNGLRDWKMLSSAQYLSMEGMANFVGQEDRAINRAQMELVAGRVSSYNECFY
jgi:alkylhydroperoxidase family enzyme